MPNYMKVENYIGENNMDIEQILYNKMCCGCIKEKFCHEECEYCDAFLDALENYDKQPKTKYKELTIPQKFEIYNRTNSGIYFVKEILTLFNITRETHKKVMLEIATLIDKELKTCDM